jgi:hypothetical protein
MQVIDWISSNNWTDKPECVHPVLRSLAIRVNDSLGNNERQKLLDLAPRLMNTNATDNQLSVDLAIFCAEQVLHIFEDKYPNDDRPRKAIEAAKSGDSNAANAANDAKATAKAAAKAAAYAKATAKATAKAAAAKAAAKAAAAATNAAYAATNAAYAAAYASAYAAAEAAASAYAAAANAANYASYDLLLKVLDEYERLTGHVSIEVDWAPVCEVMKG